MGACRCDACGAILAVEPARKACPSCMAEPFTGRLIETAEPATGLRKPTGAGRAGYLAARITAVVLLAVGTVFVLERFMPSSTDANSVLAVTACQDALRGAAINPSRAIIPYRGPVKSDGVYLVSWPSGTGLQLQNGGGTLVDASASCDYSASHGKVTTLTVNGKVVFEHQRRDR